MRISPLPNTLSSAALLLMAFVVPLANAQTRDLISDKPSAGTFTIKLNPEYASGKYGGDTLIEDQYLGLGLRYDTQSWTFKGTLPYLRVMADRPFTRVDQGQIICTNDRGGRGGSGSGGSGSGSGSSGSGSSSTSCTTIDPTTTTVGNKTTTSGLGDISASATYHVAQYASGLNIDLTGRGQFDTAAAHSGLGSGRNDFSLALGLSYEAGDLEPYLDIGYKWRGKSASLDLLNQTFLAVGARYSITKATGIDLSYDYRTKTAAGEPAAQAATLSLSSRLTRNWKLEGYYSHGLSDVVAEHVVGVVMGYRF
jgi:hypothetical protein